MTAKVS